MNRYFSGFANEILYTLSPLPYVIHFQPYPPSFGRRIIGDPATWLAFSFILGWSQVQIEAVTVYSCR